MYFIKGVSKSSRLSRAGMENYSDLSKSSNSVFFKNLTVSANKILSSHVCFHYMCNLLNAHKHDLHVEFNVWVRQSGKTPAEVRV